MSQPLNVSVNLFQVQPEKALARVAPVFPEPTITRRHDLLQDLQVPPRPALAQLLFTANALSSSLVLTLFAVSHQNGGLRNTNHVANQRNSHHHNQRHPSSGSSRPVLPSNPNQLRERGSSRPQPNLDCLRVPDQGAAGWEAQKSTQSKQCSLTSSM